MATTITTAGKNLMLTTCKATIAYAALLTSGDVEATGGNPAYARKAITFADAANGAMALNGTLPVFDVPAGFTVGKVAYYSALTSGTQYAVDVVTSEAFAAQGTYTLTSGTITLADPA